MISIEFLAPPDEGDLWLSSPWYQSGSSGAGPSGLSALAPLHYPSSSGAAAAAAAEAPPWRFAPLCNRSRLQEVSDDTWLYRRWLDELHTDERKGEGGEGHGGCREIRDIMPQVVVAERTSPSLGGVPSVGVASLEEALRLMEEEQDAASSSFSSSSASSSHQRQRLPPPSHAVLRLPMYDAAAEPMGDLELLLMPPEPPPQRPSSTTTAANASTATTSEDGASSASLSPSQQQQQQQQQE